MSWNIDPCSSVGPLRLGMTRNEVAAELGAPEAEVDNTGPGDATTSVVEVRSPKAKVQLTLEFRDDALAAIDVDAGKGFLFLDELDLFGQGRKKILDALSQRSRSVFETFDGFIFPDLCLVMSSAANMRDNPSIALHARDLIDEAISEELKDGLGAYVKQPD